jgi:hypothetical protein
MNYLYNKLFIMGAKFKNSVIHLAASADFSNFVYNTVYAGANTTATINGTTVTMVGGTKLDDLVIQSASGTNVYLLGYNKNITFGII